MTSDVETNIVAVERIKEYEETPQVRFSHYDMMLITFIIVDMIKIPSNHLFKPY
jgi:hypothetical protein